MISLALVPAMDTVVTVVPVESVGSASVFGSRVLPVPLVSVGSVVSVVAVVSNCSGQL